MDFSDELLYESKTVRDTGIIKLKAQQSEEKIFKKVKNLFFALWNNVGRLSREQVAEFYEVPVSTIDSNYKNYKDEFDLDGVKPFEGQDLRELKSILPIGQNANQAVVYTPSGVLRMGFILRDSLIAKSVRTQSIRFIQGIGQEIGKEEALKELIKYNSVLSPLIESNKLIVSAFYSPYWHLMKSTFSRNYPYGGIPKVFSHDSSEKSDFLSTDDIRKEIQFLSTYTDNCKLQGLKEHRYKLASEVRARYPHLTSDVFNFEVDSQAGTAVFMFQFDNLILDTTYLEDCISRQYIQVAKDFFKVDRAYLFFVTPFGATSFAEAYIKERLPVEYDGYVGVLTVKQLANFLYCQALSSRKLGSVKGDLKQDFDLLLNYKFPEPPPLVVQTSLF